MSKKLKTPAAMYLHQDVMDFRKRLAEALAATGTRKAMLEHTMDAVVDAVSFMRGDKLARALDCLGDLIEEAAVVRAADTAKRRVGTPTAARKCSGAGVGKAPRAEVARLPGTALWTPPVTAGTSAEASRPYAVRLYGKISRNVSAPNAPAAVALVQAELPGFEIMESHVSQVRETVTRVATHPRRKGA